MDDSVTYALLSASAYDDVRTRPGNRAPLPSGWKELSKYSRSGSGVNAQVFSSGFSAKVFQGPSGQIVISYAGTEFDGGTAGQWDDFVSGNVPLGVGAHSAQADQAALLYQEVQTDFPSSEISFTGHSLGGGLAGLMAVWFNRPAIVFDPAPFAISGVNGANGLNILPYSIASAMQSAKEYLLDNIGYVDNAFDSYDTSQFGTREQNVTAYAIAGEVLEADFGTAFDIEGSRTEELVGNTSNVDVKDKHSIDLLAATLMNSNFAKAATDIPQLLEVLFNKTYHGAAPVEDTQNFLELLLNGEVGSTNSKYGTQTSPPTSLLTKFSADVIQLDSAYGMVSQPGIQKGLIVAAEEYYFYTNPGSTTALFTSSGGGVHFDTSTIAAGNPSSPLISPALIAAGVEAMLTAAEVNSISSVIKSITDWDIQVGDGNGMTFTGGAAATELMLGGPGIDNLQGGSGTDVLIGGAGQDFLTAGSGSDTLLGGVGLDIYAFNGKFGTDVVLDSDDQGSITFDGTALGTAQATGKPNQWAGKSSNGEFIGYALYNDALSSTGVSLAITRNGIAGVVDVRDFNLAQAESSSGYLGIYLTNNAKAALGTPNASQAFSNSAPTQGTLTKDGSGTFSVLLGQVATAAMTLVVKLTGGNAADFAISTGSQLLQFSNGQTQVTIPAGDDGRSFSLVNTKDPGQNVSAQLDFSLLKADGTDSGISVNSLNFNLTESTASQDNTDVLNGVFDPATGITDYSSEHQNLPGDSNDIVDAGNGPNSIATYGGNDSITSGSGNDFVYVYSGNDTIATGGGQDSILAGNGNDEIFAGTTNDLNAALSNAQQGATTGKQGTIIGTGNGNSEIFGSNGNDYIQVGQGNNVIVAGPGNDTIAAGNAKYLLDNFNWSASIDGPFSFTGQGLEVQPSGYVAQANYEGMYFNYDYTGGSAPVGIGNDTIYGGKGDSFFVLSNGDNYVDAGGGNDSIAGGMGSDTIFGSTGNVTVVGGGGNTYIDGESGNDLLLGEGGDNTIIGGSGNDTIFAGDNAEFATLYKNSTWDKAETGSNYVDGGSGDDLIYGSGGNDTLIAGSGATTIVGGFGNESIEGGSGDDSLYSSSAAAGTDGAGVTSIIAGDGNNTLIGGAGDDSLYGGDGSDHIESGSGNQYIETGDGGTVDAPTQVLLSSGNDTVVGGSGIAEVEGGSGNDTMTAGTGDTTLQGGSGTDVMYAGDGDDLLVATSGSDTMYGGAGNATLEGGTGTVVMYSGDGSNELIAGAGNATLNGGDGDSTLEGGSGTVTMQAGDGDELLAAGTGNASIYGGSGDSTMQGGSGQTLMVAGTGSTTMIGGSGQDTFQVGADAGDVVIGDFGPGDVLQLADGVSIDDLTISDGSSADGSIDGLEIDLAGGGSVLLAGGNYSAASKVSLSDGTTYTAAQLIDSTSSATTVTLADGTSGYQTVAPSGQGKTSLTTYDADGDVTSSATDTNDGRGNSSSTSYSSTGAETDTSYTHQDGSSATTHFDANGGEYGSQRNSNGTSTTFTNDGQGDTTTMAFDAAGHKTGTTAVSADGSSVADTYAADGSYVELAADVAGDTTTTRFASDGTELGDAWTKVDGTSGSDTFNADGSIVRVGTDAQGTTTTTNIDASGAETSSSFVQANGARGVELFNADGSTLTTVTHPDGTATRTTDDGAGDTTVTQVDATGHASSDTWVRSDASHGTDTFQANGSSSGTSHNADGTTSQYVDDGAGDRTTTLLDSNGNEKSDAWTKADGSHGTDTVNSDGSVSHLSISPEGKISYSVTDAQGNVIASGGSGDGVDSSQHGALAQEAAFAAKLSQYLVSNPSASYATPVSQTVPVQDVYSDDSVIHAASDARSSVASSTSTVTTTTLVTTTSSTRLYDKWVPFSQLVNTTFNLNDFAFVTGTDSSTGQQYLEGAWEYVGDTKTTTTSHPVTTTQTVTTYTSYVAGSIEQLDTGDADHTIQLQGPDVIVNAGAGDDFIAPSGSTAADVSTEQPENLYVTFPPGSYQPSFNMAGAVGSFLNGGAGNDTIIGTYRDDTLVGGAGNDTLNGGAGSDTYLVFGGDDQGWDTIEDTGYVDPDEPWIAQEVAEYGGLPATDTVAFQEGIRADQLQLSWGHSDTGQVELDISWGGQSGIRIVIPSADQVEMGEGIEQFTFTDGTTLTMSQMLALAPPMGPQVQSGSDPYDASLGYALSWSNSQNVDGSQESIKTYTYADGSTYSTDTRTQPNGTVDISWTRSDGTHGSSTDDGHGNTVSTQVAVDGSSTQTWADSDGSSGTNVVNAMTGETSGTKVTSSGETDTWDNIPLADGSVESRTSITYANGSSVTGDKVTKSDGTYTQTLDSSNGTVEVRTFDGSTTDDKVSQPDGSYVEHVSSTNGTFENHSFDATTGEDSGSSRQLGNNYVETWDNKAATGGGSDQTLSYAYDDGSTYTTDLVTQADGATSDTWSDSDGSRGTDSEDAAATLVTHTWARSDGSSGTDDVNLVTGEKSGTRASADGDTSTYDNLNLAGGALEAKSTSVSADGSSESTDTITQPDGTYTDSWAHSDGSSGTDSLDAAGVLTTHSSTQSDGISTTDDKVTQPDGSYVENIASSDGTFEQHSFDAATGEDSGSSRQAGDNYVKTWDDKVLAAGASDQTLSYAYDDGSTYATDTVTQADGALSDSWSSSDGSSGTDSVDASGTLVSHSWVRSDGSSGTDNANLVTGENSGTRADAAGDSSTYDDLNLAGGADEAKSTYLDADGSSGSKDTITQTDGTYTDTWARSDGSSGTDSLDTSGVLTSHSSTQNEGVSATDDKVTQPDGSYVENIASSDGAFEQHSFDAASGEDSGSSRQAGDNYVRTSDNTVLAGGASDQKLSYAYDDGSTYAMDTVTQADGASVETWTSSDGTYGMNEAGAQSGAGDSFSWGLGGGKSTLQTFDGNDRLEIGQGVAEDQLWFRQDGSNLDIAILGTNDQIAIDGWFNGPANQLQSISLSTGELLVGTDVQKLVDAMATFAVPDAAQTAYTPQEQSALTPVLAANWH